MPQSRRNSGLTGNYLRMSRESVLSIDLAMRGRVDMRLVLTGAFLLATTLGCGAAEPTAAAGDCNVRATSAWAVAGAGYTAQAISDGPTCEQAVLLLVVRDPSGKAVWTDSARADQLMTFQGVTDKTVMTTTLADWINQEDSMMKKGEALPAWDADQPQPVSGEFPFYLDEGIDRELYEKVRRANGPLFCYVQGMESMACVSLDTTTGEMTRVGAQSFPG
jgi:hypothetical protein